MPLDFENQPTTFSGSSGITNNTTPVVIVSTPPGGRNRRIDKGGISITNLDNASGEMLVIRSGSLNGVIVDCVILDPGDRWSNPGQIVLNSGQDFLTISLTQNATLNQMVWNVSFFELAVEG